MPSVARRCSLWHVPVILLVCSACGGGEDDDGTTAPAGAGAGGGTATGAGGNGVAGGPSQGGGGSGETCLTDPGLCGGTRPACSATGECVECTPTNTTQCTGSEAICDDLANVCGPCRYHRQCPGSACNVFTGACMMATPVTVGPDASDDFSNLVDALAAVPSQGEAVISVKESGSSFGAGVTIDEGRVIALLADGGRPTLVGGAPSNLSAAMRVRSKAVVMVAGLKIALQRASIDVSDGSLALDRVELSAAASLGSFEVIRATSGSELRLRSSFVVGGPNVRNGIVLSTGAELDVLYSSVAATGSDGATIECNAPVAIAVRNSILLSNGPTVLDGSCGAASEVTYTAATSLLDGTANTTFAPSSGLFDGVIDLRLTAAGVQQFEGTALWRDFDPRVDVDGTPRANLVDSSPDVAGAHLGPP